MAINHHFQGGNGIGNTNEKKLYEDLIIEGLSLARTQKEEFASVLNSNNNDIEALFKVLEEFSKN